MFFLPGDGKPSLWPDARHFAAFGVYGEQVMSAAWASRLALRKMHSSFLPSQRKLVRWQVEKERQVVPGATACGL